MRAAPPCAPNDDIWVGCSANVSCDPHVPPVTTTCGGEPQPPSAPNDDNGDARVGRCAVDDDKDTLHETPIVTAQLVYLVDLFKLSHSLSTLINLNYMFE